MATARRGIHERLDRLDEGQRRTHLHLTHIDETLRAVSRVFELMHERFEALEHGQSALVEGQRSLVEGQKLVVDRLDRLIDATTRERTLSIERLARLEQRVEVVEHRLGDRT